MKNVGRDDKRNQVSATVIGGENEDMLGQMY